MTRAVFSSSRFATFPESPHTARNLQTKINWGADPGPSGAPGRQRPKWGSHR